MREYSTLKRLAEKGVIQTIGQRSHAAGDIAEPDISIDRIADAGIVMLGEAWTVRRNIIPGAGISESLVKETI